MRLYRARRLTRDDEDAQAAEARSKRYRPPAPTAGSDDSGGPWDATGGRSGGGASGCGRRRRRTDGCASQASAPASPIALMPEQRRLQADGIGDRPADAMPSGMRPTETLKS